MFQPLSRLLKSYILPARVPAQEEPKRGEPKSLLEQLPLAIIQNDLLDHVVDPADRHALACVERALWPLVKDHVAHKHLSTIHAWLSQIGDHHLPQSYAEVMARTQEQTLPRNWGDAARAADYLLFNGPLGRIGYDDRSTPQAPLSVEQAALALHDVSTVMRRAASRRPGQPLADVVSSQDLAKTRDHLFDLRELAYLPLQLYKNAGSDEALAPSAMALLGEVADGLKNLTGRNAKSWSCDDEDLGDLAFPPLHLYLPELQQISLKNSGLSTMPAELTKLGRLTSLDMRNNKLSTWAQDAPSLPRLTHLYLTKNSFETLPESLLNCTALTHLSMGHNRLTEIPDALGQLVRLEELYVDHNAITEFPRSVSALKNLRIFNISSNPSNGT